MCGGGGEKLCVPDKCASFLSSPACRDKALSITRPSHSAEGPTAQHGLDSVPSSALHQGPGEGGGRGWVRGGWTGEMGSLEIQASVGGGRGGSRPSSLNKISHPKARNILHHVGYDNHVNRRLLSW